MSVSSYAAAEAARSGAGPIARLAARIAALHGWRRYGAALLSGAVTSLAFAPFHLSVVLLATLPALLCMVAPAAIGVPDSAHVASQVRRGFWSGWWFGFGFHLVGLHWIGHAFLVQADVFAWALPIAVTLMPAGLALFFGLAGAVAAAVPERVMPGAITLAVALTGAEWLRGTILTGFPWNTIGYALTSPLVMMQSAALIGIYGLTLIAALIALLPVQLLTGNRPRPRSALAAVLLPLAVMVAWGSARLAQEQPPDVPGVRLRLVQPSIDQTDKWRPELQREIFERHLALSRQDASGRDVGLDGITHLLWAEAAMPFGPLASPAALAALAELVPDKTILVAGILRSAQTERRRLAFNSAAAFDGSGQLVALYDKVHLVPFGEYLPLPWLLDRIGLETLTRQRGGFTPGPARREPVAVPGLPPVEVLICYEGIFPAEAGRTTPRAAALLNLTNDGWFGTFSGPWQHFHQVRVRAVEQGVPVVRVSNNGISAIVDAHGRIRGQIGLNAVGTHDGAMPGPLASAPIYARAGDVAALLLAMLALVAGAVAARLSRAIP